MFWQCNSGQTRLCLLYRLAQGRKRRGSEKDAGGLCWGWGNEWCPFGFLWKHVFVFSLASMNACTLPDLCGAPHLTPAAAGRIRQSKHTGSWAQELSHVRQQTTFCLTTQEEFSREDREGRRRSAEEGVSWDRNEGKEGRRSLRDGGRDNQRGRDAAGICVFLSADSRLWET